MNKPFNVLFVVLLSVMTMSSQSKQVSTINNNWKFHKGDFEVDKNDAIKGLMLSNDTNWETITYHTLGIILILQMTFLDIFEVLVGTKKTF